MYIRRKSIRTYGDFDYFVDNYYLCYKLGEFIWKPIKKSYKIVGKINTWQQSCPTVSILIYILEEEKVIYKYTSFCGWEISTTISWTNKKTNKKYKATFEQDKLCEDIEEIDDIIDDDDIDDNKELFEKLEINDFCNLIKRFVK